MPAAPKLHHYVPQGYLRQFLNSAGRLYAYRKDDPKNPHPKLTREVAAQNNYYTQPKPDGSLDRGLEEFFQITENDWPEIFRFFDEERQLPARLVEPFFQFLGAMRVRGPATRDAVELATAEQVRATGEMMERRGDFPKPPDGLEEVLAMKNLVLSIDPHQSIHALPPLLNGFARVLDVLGFSLVRNETDVSLITSDNPVVYFDPTIPEHNLRPYAIENGPPVELLFPLSPKLLLVGHSDWMGPTSHSVFKQFVCRDPQEMRRANRHVARFAYKEIYAADRSHDLLVEKWADTSPIIRNTTVKMAGGTAVISQWVFGNRPTKPKWKRPTA